MNDQIICIAVPCVHSSFILFQLISFVAGPDGKYVVLQQPAVGGAAGGVAQAGGEVQVVGDQFSTLPPGMLATVVSPAASPSKKGLD